MESDVFGSSRFAALSQAAAFSDPIWATVAGSSASSGKSGVLHLFVEVSSQLNETTDAALLSSLLRHSGRLYLAESPTFYRAYGPALEQLQRMRPDTFPFHDEVVCGEPREVEFDGDVTIDASVIFTATSATNLPVELRHLSKMPIAKMIDELEKIAFGGQWSPDLSTTLDESQCDAILKAIKQRIAIIQGPPGTGKTFVGVRIVRLLSSLSTSDTEGPILVMTYKNRALDDFLTDCLSIWPEGVARLGGTAQPGSLLEHRHINMLVKSMRRIEEHEAAKARAEQSSQAVQTAAQALSTARYFSPSSFLDHPSEWALSSLLLHDETVGEAEQAEIKVSLHPLDRLLRPPFACALPRARGEHTEPVR